MPTHEVGFSLVYYEIVSKRTGDKMKERISRYLAVISFLAISGCATSMEREFQSFWQDWYNYGNSVSDEKNNLTVPDSVYFNESLKIAMLHHQYGYEKIFKMMRLEAIKKERGLSNQLDALETRLKNQDTSLAVFAEDYEINMNGASQCTKFGYKENTPDFNKCVYDFRMNYLSLMMQQQQFMIQTMPRPAPLYIPTQTHTNCNPTWGGGFSCTTK